MAVVPDDPVDRESRVTRGTRGSPPSIGIPTLGSGRRENPAGVGPRGTPASRVQVGYLESKGSQDPLVSRYVYLFYSSIS